MLSVLFLPISTMTIPCLYDSMNVQFSESSAPYCLFQNPTIMSEVSQAHPTLRTSHIHVKALVLQFLGRWCQPGIFKDYTHWRITFSSSKYYYTANIYIFITLQIYIYIFILCYLNCFSWGNYMCFRCLMQRLFLWPSFSVISLGLTWPNTFPTIWVALVWGLVHHQ